MQNNSLATAKRSARLARYWRPIGKLAATSAVLVGAVAWTATLDTPLRHRASDAPTVVQALVARPVAPAPTLPVSDEARGIARLLERRTNDATLAQRIANAIVTEGEKRHVKPTLLVGMLLTPWPREASGWATEARLTQPLLTKTRSLLAVDEHDHIPGMKGVRHALDRASFRARLASRHS